MRLRSRDWELLGRQVYLPRVGRYVIVGAASALTHLTLLVLFVEVFEFRPAIATSVAFVCLLAAAFLLQHHWVFRSSERMARTAPRFVSVATVALVLNATIVHVGTVMMEGPYVAVQLVAFVVIPIANYLMHSLWTFAERRDRG